MTLNTTKEESLIKDCNNEKILFIFLILYSPSIYQQTNMKTIINSDHAPKPVGPYSQAVRAGNTLYISGQVAIDPISNTIIKSNIEDETTQIMKNIENILKEAGLMFDNVVRTKIYLTNMNDFSAVNNVYGSYFKSNPPARTTIEVSGLPLGVNVEIDMIAVFNN